MIRKIIAYKHYFADFVELLTSQEKKKLQRALALFAEAEKIPYHYIKYLRDGVYEFRVTSMGNELRTFFTYDGDTIVILFNGFKKKTQKTPKRELEKAIKLKEEYYGTKTNR